MLRHRAVSLLRSVFAAPAAGRTYASSAPLFRALTQPVKVLFGSQTGTAQWFAELLRKDLRARSIKAEVLSLEDYDPESLAEEDLAVFIMACYGKGEPTDNARDFYSWITSNEREPGLLNNVNYAFFGLGNKQTYPERYQQVGKTVYPRLAQLGATSLLERGEGDDNGGIDGDFSVWKAKFMAALDVHTGTAPQAAAAYTAPFTVKLLDEGQLPRHRKAPTQEQWKAISRIKHLPLLANEELFSDTSPPGFSCRHIEVDLANSGLTYETGDHLAIYPHNSPSQVERTAARLGVSLDKYFQLVPKAATHEGEPLNFPEPCTLRAALTRHLDLHSFPKSDVLKVLASFASAPSEAAELLRLSDPTHKADFDKTIVGERMSLVDVLEAFPSVALPLEAFLDLTERAKPRYYSISSSPLMHPTAIHLTVRVLEQKTPSGKIFRGKCTNYLVSQPVGDSMSSLSVTTRPSKFRLPASPLTPVLMIGAGSGFAPLRGFLQERVAAKTAGVALGETHLYFGCMKRDLDFIYKDEIESAVADKVLTHFVPAFSHEQADFIFVQDKLYENKEEVWRLINDKGAYVYVCGAAHTMARGVYNSFVRIIQECGNRSPAAAEVFLKQLESKGRYQQDVF